MYLKNIWFVKILPECYFHTLFTKILLSPSSYFIKSRKLPIFKKKRDYSMNIFNLFQNIFWNATDIRNRTKASSKTDNCPVIKVEIFAWGSIMWINQT